MRSSDYKVTWDVKWQAPFSVGTFGFNYAASIGDKAYFVPVVDSGVVCEYLSSTGAWQELPPCGVRKCALANVRGTLTTVGGHPHVGTGMLADCLCWDEASRCWESRYPPLPELCYCPAVAATADHLIAVPRGASSVDHVWVMDINTRQWSSYAIPLLHYPRSVAVCNGTVYVACFSVYPSRCMLCHCSLDALLQSTPQQRVWQATNCPGSFDSHPALVTVNNKLLCIFENAILIFEKKKVLIPVESIPVCSDLSFGYRYVVCPLPGGRLLLCTRHGVIFIGKFVSSGILNIVYRVQALLCSQFSSIAICYVSLWPVIWGVLNFVYFSVSSFSYESKNPRDIRVTKLKGTKIKFQGPFDENCFPQKSSPDYLEKIVTTYLVSCRSHVIARADRSSYSHAYAYTFNYV